MWFTEGATGKIVGGLEKNCGSSAVPEVKFAVRYYNICSQEKKYGINIAGTCPGGGKGTPSPHKFEMPKKIH